MLLLFLLIDLSTGQFLEKERAIWVEQGMLRGKVYKMGNRQLQIFRGVPYAEPPIGDLRFKRPVKKQRWDREFTAVEYGPPCLQFMHFHKNDRYSGQNMKRESEDCLYLNVFAPYDVDEETKLSPILVWIHGGSFLAGSGDTGINMEVVANNIVFKGVTLITLNYRLGPLGFMNYEENGKTEGNHGIWDIVMALQWIQTNIKQLNGDPSRVVLMGESAGAAAVSVLALSPLTKDLVHAAIIMSGSSTAGWAMHGHGTPAWELAHLTAYLRCEKNINEEETNEIIGEEYSNDQVNAKQCNYQDTKMSCLTADLSTQEVLDCFRKELNLSSPLFRKALAIELGVSKMVKDGELVPERGVDLVKNYARIPILIGVAKNEWSHKKPQFYDLYRLANLTKEEVGESVFRVVDGSFHQTSPEKLSNATLMLISNASFVRYMDHPSNTYSSSRVVSVLQKMEADIEFVAPCDKEISAYVERNVPVYAYSFDFTPTSPLFEEEKKVFSLFGKQPVDVIRKDTSFAEPFHGLDHAYIFSKGYTSNFEISPFTKRDELMSKLLTNMWTNFVKTGNPSTPRFSWLPYAKNQSQYASIDIPPKMIKGEIHWPDAKFWNVEAEMISKYVPRGSEQGMVDPESELTNEERVELGAYRRAWWALWVLVAVLIVILWAAVIYVVVIKSKSPRSKPYDNIAVAR